LRLKAFRSEYIAREIWYAKKLNNLYLLILYLNAFIYLLINLSCGLHSNKKGEELIYNSPHFRISYTEYDKGQVKRVADTLEKYYLIVTGNLTTGEMAKVNINFYEDYHSLKDAVRFNVPDLPEWATGLATSATQIHMISPFHSRQSPDEMIRVAVHEFVHCATLAINPAFGNNPRWLWESVAIYESGQFRDPSQASYLVDHDPPHLKELNDQNDPRVYELGFLVGEYIIVNWGYIKLKELIRNGGQVQRTLGLDEEQFIINWFNFVKTKYSL
jgi:hypothetical protein